MSDIRERARIALITKVEALRANFYDYPLVIEYANLPVVNLSMQTDPYLRVGLKYADGNQIDLGTDPGHRLLGTIVLEARVKEGMGTGQANSLLAHFYPSIHMKDTLQPLRTRAARFATPPNKDGWATETALIPFWLDSFA